MTIFYPDISSFQAGISLQGALACACKVTEGSGYANYDYGRAKSDAATRGVFFFAYHFLYGGDGSGQAQWAFEHAGTTPLMLDVEADSADVPTIQSFVTEYRKLGGVVHLVYLPHWYWQDIGSPDLSWMASWELALVSSAYTPYTDSGSGTGWMDYGGMAPAIWQYSDATQFNGFFIDFNAFRGSYAGKEDPASVAACLAEFKQLVTTGSFGPPPPPPVKYAVNPVRALKAAARYTEADISWDASKNAAGYRVVLKRWLITVADFTQTATSVTLRDLSRGKRYKVSVLAVPASASDSIAGRASIHFSTKP